MPLLGIATNGFFVFAPFPASDSFASFLLGQSVQFFQGGGDFNRGLRKWVAAGYAQDEFRISPRLTLNFGLRYEVNTPYVDIRNRMNAWAPGQQSTVYPNAPEGLLFPGDPGVPAGIARGRLSRVHAARGPRLESVRRQQDHRAGRLRHFLRWLHQRPGRSAASVHQRAAVDPGVSVARPGIQPGQSLWRRRYPVRQREFRRAGHRAHRAIGNAAAVLAELESLHRADASRRTICSTFATSATRARICRASSKRIPPSMGRASTRTTTTRSASTPRVTPPASAITDRWD